MTRVEHGIVALGLAALVGGAAWAQPQAGGGQPPPPPTNLQVLTPDTPRARVVQTMQTFTQGLGVRCEYCHVDEGPGRQDFASDAKPTKNVARAMMRLVMDLNVKVPVAVGKTPADATSVQCATCHRGLAIPRQLDEVLTQTMTAKGMVAAVDQFRTLRTQYYGGQSYDFSEGSLAALGQRLTAAGKVDEAIAWLQLNLEFYPRSARTYQGLGLAYVGKKDTENAVKAFEKALEIDPQNAQAKRQLEQLKK